MCGRVFIKQTPAFDALLPTLGITEQLPLLLNVAPTQQIPVIRQSAHGSYSMESMRWWLHPSWSPTPPDQSYATFNARIETVGSNKSFRVPIKRQRAIIPVAGFVEWKKIGIDKQPYYIEAEGDAPMLLAGIWDIWHDTILSCAIITQEASKSFAHIHNRMPLSLTVDEAIEWMDISADGGAITSKFAGKSLPLKVRRVSQAINNTRNKVDVEFISGADSGHDVGLS